MLLLALLSLLGLAVLCGVAIFAFLLGAHLTDQRLRGAPQQRDGARAASPPLLPIHAPQPMAPRPPPPMASQPQHYQPYAPTGPPSYYAPHHGNAAAVAAAAPQPQPNTPYMGHGARYQLGTSSATPRENVHASQSDYQPSADASARSPYAPQYAPAAPPHAFSQYAPTTSVGRNLNNLAANRVPRAFQPAPPFRKNGRETPHASQMP